MCPAGEGNATPSRSRRVQPSNRVEGCGRSKPGQARLMLPGCRGDERADAAGGFLIKGMPRSHKRWLACNLIETRHHPLAGLSKSWGAKRGANAGRPQATQSDTQRRLIQLSGTSSDTEPRPGTVRLRLTSEGSLVRTQLRPPKLSQLDGTFETLIGDSGTTAGNHPCMLPGEGSVPGGHGRVPAATRVRRAAAGLAGAGSARGGRIRGVRPSWCACLVVSQVAGARPEEARAIWLGGRRDRCSTKEGFPGSSRLQHALMPM